MWKEIEFHIFQYQKCFLKFYSFFPATSYLWKMHHKQRKQLWPPAALRHPPAVDQRVNQKYFILLICFFNSQFCQSPCGFDGRWPKSGGTPKSTWHTLPWIGEWKTTMHCHSMRPKIWMVIELEIRIIYLCLWQ